MNKYGIIKNNIVESVFYSELSASDYPDIQAWLMVVPDNVESNYSYDPIEETFSAPIGLIKDVTPRQLKQALVLSGVSLEDINTQLNSLSEPTKSLAFIEWEYSIAFQRNRPLVNSVAAMLGWTSEQVDVLWRLAATL